MQNARPLNLQHNEKLAVRTRSGAVLHSVVQLLSKLFKIDRLISPDLFLKKMETNIGMYLYWRWAVPFSGTSLQDAGAQTALPVPGGAVAKTYNRPGVYSGGWVAAFCLDTMIQKQSGGQKELDDLFRLMESRFGLTGTEYTPEDLQRAASEVAGINLADFSAQRARYSYQRQTSAPSNSSLTHHFGRRCAILSIDARQILVAGAFHTTGAFARQIRF